MKTHLFILITLLFLLLTSCMKDNYYYGSKESNLTGGSSKNWRISRMTFDGNNAGACLLDNTMTFHSNNTLKEYTNSNKCAGDPEVWNNTWNLDSDGSTLTVNSTVVWTVDELTKNVVRLHLTNNSGQYVVLEPAAN